MCYRYIAINRMGRRPLISNSSRNSQKKLVKGRNFVSEHEELEIPGTWTCDARVCIQVDQEGW